MVEGIAVRTKMLRSGDARLVGSLGISDLVALDLDGLLLLCDLFLELLHSSLLLIFLLVEASDFVDQTGAFGVCLS